MKLTGTLREASAEFLGTFILMIFGLGVVAQTVLSRETAGSPLSIHLAWGLAVILGVYTAAGVSGAHINPAVTLALAVRRGFPWRKVIPYVLAQFLGAFVASAVVYMTYAEALDHFDGGIRQVAGPVRTAGIWATYPQDFVSVFPGGFIDQVVGTALLMIGVLAATDDRNRAPHPGLIPIIIGLLVVAIGMCFGFNTGYAINPARDFGPRLFTAIAGWGTDVFTAGNAWWWVPIVGPIIGGVIGAYIYDLFVANHHPEIKGEPTLG
ncbi:MAG: MIP family channel protein [Vicinamibacteraceae bacterium]